MSSLELSRHIKAPLEKVFEAWSDSKLMSQWFFPGEWTCEARCDFRVGGAYEVMMHKPDEDLSFRHWGEYREIHPNQKIVFTWNSHIVEGTLVTLEFEPQGDTTLMTLFHDMFPTEDVRAKHKMGWGGCLDNFEALFHARVTG